MEEHIVKILAVEPVTHNVRRFKIEKPAGYRFVPGQATEVSINTPELREERRPFTFTSLADAPHLEFTIKIYTDHEGVTNALGKLQAGDELLLHDVWGAISYKGAGVFIAGGAGITPFIAILRELNRKNELSGNTLIFSNRTESDIILKEEFDAMHDLHFLNTLTSEERPGYLHGRIDKAFLQKHISDFKQHFYICGPDAFVSSIADALTALGADSEAVVFEK